MPLQSHDSDECCGEALSNALLEGDLDDVDTWTHEECGCVWAAEMSRDGAVRHWRPIDYIEVFKL